MNAIVIDVPGLEQLAALWAAAPNEVRAEMETAMIEADALAEREITEITPRAAGLLAGSIGSEVQSFEDSVIGVVGTSAAYAVPVELGTRPHFPPIEPLVDWVRVKLGVGEKEARGVAFLVARKISRTGTKGAHMFERALSSVEPGIAAIFHRALDRIVKRLAGQ